MPLSQAQIPIKVMVQTGDTPAGESTAMTKNLPHILVTTPESLFLMVASDSGRKIIDKFRLFPTPC